MIRIKKRKRGDRLPEGMAKEEILRCILTPQYLVTTTDIKRYLKQPKINIRNSKTVIGHLEQLVKDGFIIKTLEKKGLSAYYSIPQNIEVIRKFFNDYPGLIPDLQSNDSIMKQIVDRQVKHQRENEVVLGWRYSHSIGENTKKEYIMYINRDFLKAYAVASQTFFKLLLDPQSPELFWKYIEIEQPKLDTIDTGEFFRYCAFTDASNGQLTQHALRLIADNFETQKVVDAAPFTALIELFEMIRETWGKEGVDIITKKMKDKSDKELGVLFDT